MKKLPFTLADPFEQESELVSIGLLFAYITLMVLALSFLIMLLVLIEPWLLVLLPVGASLWMILKFGVKPR